MKAERSLFTVYRYSRADLLRILRLTARQLAGWEKAELVAVAESYSFFDLLQIKKIRDLCAHKVRPAVIRRSLDAMQKQAAGMENPLVEASVFSAGHRIAFRHQGRLVEPIAGQFMFDFSARDNVVPVPRSRWLSPGRFPRMSLGFSPKALHLKRIPTRRLRRLRLTNGCWNSIPSTRPRTSTWARCTTTGRITRLSEKHYRAAIEIDPRYALAYFDLGNVLDETGRVAAAIQAYNTALQLAPTYGDAHYNLALAYEKVREPRKALKHWRAYVKLDTSGPWAVHARNQIQRILQADGLKLVYKQR